MARAWRIRYAVAKYHVTVRGNGRQCVFHDDDYYFRFIEQLSEALEKDQVVLYAFALMPNHFHLLIETPFGNIQRFMQRLNTSYSMYHRYKYRADVRKPVGYDLKVGEYYGYKGNGSVLKQRQKLKELRREDPAVEKFFGRVEKRLTGD